MRIFLLFAVSMAAFAQEGQNVSIYGGVNPNPVSFVAFYPSATTQYICTAKSNPGKSEQAITAATNANPGVFTVASDHGFFDANWQVQPRIKISGGTGSWTAANGEWIANPLSATTFTIRSMSTATALDTSGLGAVAGSLIFETNAPRLNANIWAIRYLLFDGAGKVLSVLMAYSRFGGYSGNSCANRASNAYEWK